MSELPRLRRHTDGRVAFLADPGDASPWLIYMPWPILAPHGETLWAEDGDVSGDGWLELFVAELPDPDDWTDCVGDDGGDARTPYWRTSGGGSVTAWIEGVETPAWGLTEDLDQVRADALKMLAAVAECERYRAEREATP